MAEVLDWFGFKGQRCTEYGVKVEKLPPITLAEERVDFEEVTGRSGDLTITEENTDERRVFNSMVLSIECFVENIDRLEDMAAWLLGSGALVLPNRPGGYYSAHVVNEMELDRVIKGRENRRFTVSFHVQPYFWLEGSADIESVAASFVITNPGSVESAPRIAIYGSGDVSIALAGQNVLLTDLEDGIIMDTALQDALSLDGAQLLNNQMSGDFLTIPPGESTMAWYAFDENDNPGTVSRIVVTPRWRCR